jgi:hypothetical protein
MTAPTPDPAFAANDDFTGDAIRRLVTQFRSGGNSAGNDLERLVASYAPELQEINDAATDLLTLVFLNDAAVGVQLDGLGELIGVERQGLGDDEYRSLLRAQVQVNKAGGTIPQLIEIVRLATNTTLPDQAIELTESFPADFVIKVLTLLDTDVGYIAAEAMYNGKAAGVHGILNFYQTEPVFAFDGAGSSKFDGGYYLKTAIRNRAARESEIL